MNLIRAASISEGIVEQRFDAPSDRGVVPGLVWTPEGARGPRPLVLVGHGAGGDKRTPYALALARRLIPAGFAVAAIDAIGHGDRSHESILAGEPGMAPAITPAFIVALVEAIEGMTADWTATLAGLRSLDAIGEGPVGYWGLSMGTVFGLPFLAATPEVRCAVVGLMGTFGGRPPWVHPATVVACPIFFLVQKGDRLIQVKHAKALFDLLGSRDKTLRKHRGGHGDVPDKAIDEATAFFVRHLR